MNSFSNFDVLRALKALRCGLLRVVCDRFKRTGGGLTLGILGLYGRESSVLSLSPKAWVPSGVIRPVVHNCASHDWYSIVQKVPSDPAHPIRA